MKTISQTVIEIFLNVVLLIFFPKIVSLKKHLLHAKQHSRQISEVDRGTSPRNSIGAMGIHFHSHTPEEFVELTQAQCKEIRYHRVNHSGGQGGGGGGGGRGNGGGHTSKKGKGRSGKGCGSSGMCTSRGHGSGGRNGLTHTTIALITFPSADTPAAVDGVKDYILSLFRDEVAAAAGMRSQRESFSAVNYNTDHHDACGGKCIEQGRGCTKYWCKHPSIPGEHHL